jgi:hypothetical protein
MRYENIRDQIRTGDLLGFKRKTFLAKLILLLQHGFNAPAKKITHCGVAWWIEGRLYSVEMDGAHNVLRPVSQIVADSDQVFVYQNPVDESAMRNQFDRATSMPIAYGVFDLVRIGLRLIFGVPTGGDGDHDLVCSTFISRWLGWSGWIAPKDFPNMPAPAELFENFTLKFQINGG